MQRRTDFTDLSSFDRPYGFNKIMNIVNICIDLITLLVGIYMIIHLVNIHISYDSKFIQILILPTYTIIFSLICLIIDFKYTLFIDHIYFQAIPLGRSALFQFTCGQWSIIVSKDSSDDWKKILNPARICALVISFMYIILYCVDSKIQKNNNNGGQDVEDDDLFNLKPVNYEND